MTQLRAYGQIAYEIYDELRDAAQAVRERMAIDDAFVLDGGGKDLVELFEAAVKGKLDTAEAEWDRRIALGVVPSGGLKIRFSTWPSENTSTTSAWTAPATLSGWSATRFP